jgi:hypothetical protein
MERRRFLATAAAAGAVGLAGCSNVRPAPEVVGSNARGELFGPTTIDVTIENGGTGGDVTATVTTYSGDETVQSKHERTVSMSEGETREVTFEIELDSEAESYTATAAPAGPF